MPFQEIVWRDPMTNSYTRGPEDSVLVTSTDYFKFNLDKEGVGDKSDSFDPMSNVVDVHVGHLRRKLGAAGDDEMLHTVRGVGYILRRGGPE